MPDEQYWFYVEHGVCPRCRKANALPNRKFCADCLYKRNEAQIQRYRAMTEDDKKRRNERARIRYQERKSAGICVGCGKNPAKKGRVRCFECLIKVSRSAVECQRRKGSVPRTLFGDGFHCAVCGADVENRKLCDRCLANARKAVIKAREASLEHPDNWASKPFIFGKRVKT